MKTTQIPLEKRKYDSFLNRLMTEFTKAAEGADYKTQKRLLGFATSVIEEFREVYGDHELKAASTAITRMLAEMRTLKN